MAQNSQAGERRQKVIDEFAEAGFTVDARASTEHAYVYIKPYVEPGTDEYNEFVSFLKEHESVTPREDNEDTNFIFTYDASGI